MTNPERLDLLQKTLGRIYEMEKATPGSLPLISIHNQILYLIALISGKPVNKAELGEINLGFIAMREVESQDAEAAGLCYKVAREVTLMKSEPEFRA